MTTRLATVNTCLAPIPKAALPPLVIVLLRVRANLA